ncbi:phosphatidate cytidylyltransferase [candidate division KSB1 bacterium]|nr:phosphatidate cytidylyltransferase [candidate division KSB1 bacterium]
MAFAQLKSRVLVTIVGAPIVLCCVYFGNWPFLIFIAAIFVLSLREFFELSKNKGVVPNLLISIIAGLLLLYDMYFSRGEYFIPIISVYLVLISILQLWETRGSQIQNLSVNFFAVGYLGMLLSFFVGIRQLPLDLNIDYNQGGIWAITILAIFWIGDTIAYFVGSSIGKHKLATRVSPKKTIEGAIAGFISMLMVAYLSKMLFLPEWSWLDATVIGVICGTVGQMSDLVESLFKRDAGVKDTSNILPGHGGIFDRFDVLFLVSPLIFFYLKYFSSVSH